jgi:hypothetical protein
MANVGRASAQTDIVDTMTVGVAEMITVEAGSVTVAMVTLMQEQALE